MKILTILSIVFLIGCSSIISQDKYPSIEKECEMSGNKDSPQCEIITMDELTKDEKEQKMGYIYFFVNDEMKDCGKAIYWFSKAAESNNSAALNNLGMIYFTGCDVDRDYVVAKDYFLKANEFGSREAKANLGGLYREGGYGLEKNFGKAMYWYELAIKDAPARAYDGIAGVYIDQEDYEEAYKYMVQAADLGHPQSEYNLGYFYSNGIVVKEDKEKAKYWYEKAAAQGWADAQRNLDVLLGETK